MQRWPLAFFLLALLFSSPASAHSHHGHSHWPWCGWFARFHLVAHDPGPAFNLARRWASYGRPADGPQPGVLVVWPHHIGKITGQAANGLWMVLSGNDGNRVRERPRSVAGAIAFRYP